MAINKVETKRGKLVTGEMREEDWKQILCQNWYEIYKQIFKIFRESKDNEVTTERLEEELELKGRLLHSKIHTLNYHYFRKLLNLPYKITQDKSDYLSPTLYKFVRWEWPKKLEDL